MMITIVLDIKNEPNQPIDFNIITSRRSLSGQRADMAQVVERINEVIYDENLAEWQDKQDKKHQLEKELEYVNGPRV